MIRTGLGLDGVVVSLAVLAAAPAAAEVIYETDGPFGGPFGLLGADVCLTQSVGLRFTPDQTHRLDRISLWFMSNDFSGKTHPLVEVTLRTDDSNEEVSVPSDEVLEFWTFNVSAVGWDPRLEVMDSVAHPLVHHDVNYWIVAESQVVCGQDGVWNFAAFGTGFTAFSFGYGQAWQPGGSGAVVASIVEGTPCQGDLLDPPGVGIEDLLDLLATWGEEGVPADMLDPPGVGIEDFLKLLANWGECG